MSDATLPETAAGSGGASGLLSDERLARRATRGDRRAFGAIYRRYHQPLFRYCAAILGNPDDAQEALQNTMVKVLRSLPGERRHVRLKPWLYRIAHNESIELLRRRRPLDQLDPNLLLGEGDPAESAAARERLRRLIGDLHELPERQRGALVMRELGGLSFEQIGEAFQTSAAVARQTVYEGRLGLRQMSEGREMPCEEVCRALSDGDRRVARRRDIRAHLRVCEGCRSFRDGIEQRRRDLAAIAPLPPLAAAGLFHSLLGGSASGGAASAGAGVGGAGAAAGSSGLGGSAGGLGAASGFGKAIAGSALLKSAATVAVVAAVGVSAADRTGVIHVLPGDGGSTPSHTRRAPASSSVSGRGDSGGIRAHGAGAPVEGNGAAVRNAGSTAAANRGSTEHAHRGASTSASAGHAGNHSHQAAAVPGGRAASHADEHRSQGSGNGKAGSAHGAGSAAGGQGHAGTAGGRSGESASEHAAEGAGNAQSHRQPEPTATGATHRAEGGSGSEAEHSKPTPSPEAPTEAEASPSHKIGTAAAGPRLEGTE